MPRGLLSIIEGSHPNAGRAGKYLERRRVDLLKGPVGQYGADASKRGEQIAINPRKGIRVSDDEASYALRGFRGDGYVRPDHMRPFIAARGAMPIEYGVHWEDFKRALNDAEPGQYTLTAKPQSPGSGNTYFSLEGDFQANARAPKKGGITRRFKGDKALFAQLIVKDRYQKEGIARRVQAATFKAFQDMGINKVVVDAALSRGGYAWARMGATPVHPEDAFDGIILKAAELYRRGKITKERFNQIAAIVDDGYDGNAKAMWDLADMRDDIDGLPLGNRLLSGLDWQGAYDLTDPQTIERINRYINPDRDIND